MRLKWRRLSGPVWRMPVYLSFSSTMLARPLGSMRGRASSSPRICGQLVHGQLDLEDVMARVHRRPRRRPRRRSSGRSGVPTSPGPWPTPPRFLVP